MVRVLFTLTLLSGVAVSGLSADVYLVQGFARGPSTHRETIIWSTDAILYNVGLEPAVVRYLGVSNGPSDAPVPDSLSIPPGRTASLGRLRREWRPIGGEPLWVVHLDVPPEVLLTNVLFIGGEPHILAPPAGDQFRYGKLNLPGGCPELS